MLVGDTVYQIKNSTENWINKTLFADIAAFFSIWLSGKKNIFLFQSFIQQVSRLLSKKIAIYISTPFLVLFFHFHLNSFLFSIDAKSNQFILYVYTSTNHISHIQCVRNSFYFLQKVIFIFFAIFISTCNKFLCYNLIF